MTPGSSPPTPPHQLICLVAVKARRLKRQDECRKVPEKGDEDAYYCCLCAGYSSEEIRSLVLPVAPLHPLLHPLHLFKHFSLVFLSFLARLLMKRMMGMPGEW